MFYSLASFSTFFASIFNLPFTITTSIYYFDGLGVAETVPLQVNQYLHTLIAKHFLLSRYTHKISGVDVPG
jgi:hypothetical protein